MEGGILPASCARFRRRTGLTLFEILLVLVLLVVIGSLAKPIFDGAYASVRLRRAGDQVLAAWSELRLQAIQTGEAHQFVFQPESGKYRLEPWQGFSADPTTDLAVEENVEPGQWLPHEAELPEEVLFFEGDQLFTESGVDAEVQTLVEGIGSAWAEPILFFPDGSSSSASLVIKNQNDLVLRLTLRDLTGLGRASEVMTDEEARRSKGS